MWKCQSGAGWNSLIFCDDFNKTWPNVKIVLIKTQIEKEQNQNLHIIYSGKQKIFTYNKNKVCSLASKLTYNSQANKWTLVPRWYLWRLRLNLNYRRLQQCEKLTEQTHQLTNMSLATVEKSRARFSGRTRLIRSVIAPCPPGWLIPEPVNHWLGWVEVEFGFWQFARLIGQISHICRLALQAVSECPQRR